MPVAVMADQRLCVVQEAGRVRHTAMDEMLPETMGRLAIQCGSCGQFGIGLIVTGQEGDRDTCCPAGRRDFIDPVGPVAAPAQQPADHQFGGPDHLFHIEIDRHVVAQAQIICEPQGGRVGVGGEPRPVGDGQRGDLRIGGGQDQDITRALFQIDGFRSVIHRSRRCGEQMHQPIRASMAARSMPDLPITTSSVWGFRCRSSRGRNSFGSGCPRPATPAAVLCPARGRSP